MKQQPIIRDERYYAVENASYKVGFTIILFGTFFIGIVRSALFHQNVWDLLGLALLGSLAATVYQIRKKVVPYTIKTLISMLVLCVVTSVVAGLIVFWIKSTFFK